MVTKVVNSQHKDTILLNSDLEETDSRMFIHYEYFANQTLDADSGTNWILLIFSPYTDVAVLCWHHFIHFQIEELWFHTGTRRSELLTA